MHVFIIPLLYHLFKDWDMFLLALPPLLTVAACAMFLYQFSDHCHWSFEEAELQHFAEFPIRKFASRTANKFGQCDDSGIYHEI